MGDDSQDQNSSAHSGKYAQYSRWPLFSYTPKHAKLNDPTRTHWLWTMRPRTCGMRAIWQRISYNVKGGGEYKEQIQNTCRLQRVSMENGAKCSILNSRHDIGLRIPRLVSSRSSHLFPPKKMSFQRPSRSRRPKPTYPTLIMWSESKIWRHCMHDPCHSDATVADISNSNSMKHKTPRSKKVSHAAGKKHWIRRTKKKEQKNPLPFKPISPVKPTIFASRRKIYYAF